MQNISDQNTLIETIENFASSSTVIGLTRVARAKTKFMKVTWVVMTLISLAFGLYLTSETIREYLQYDVFTTIERIPSSSTLVPSVTFCFNNPETKDLRSFFNVASFNETEYNNSTNLTGEQFFDENLGKLDSGDCMKFNHFTNKSDAKIFTADTTTDLLHFDINLNMKFSFIYIFLSDNHDNILDWSQYVTTSYNVKGDYQVAFKKEVEIKLEEPYNQCKNVSDITYRQTNCLAQCKNKNFVSKYNCTLGNFYSVPSYNFCNRMISNSLEFNSVCKEECPKECTTLNFDNLISNPQLNPNSTDKLTFLVWALDLNYIEISQIPKMSGFSLLNEIGGALGLFVGLSCLSLLEFLEFFLELFYYYINN